jgi:DNA-binding IclR family transcriptional regulator
MAETSKTVSEALRLLTVVAEAPGSVADLARRLESSRTVVQRLLATLRAHGFVMRLPDGRFALGTAVTDLAGRVGTPLRLLAARHLEALAHRLNETVVLTLRQASEGVSVAQVVAPDRMVRVEYPPGFRHPLHVAAGGRAILAALDAATRAAEADRSPTPETLRAALGRARKRGYAVSVNELQQGVAGLAAPVLGPGGLAVASVGVIVPVERFQESAELAAAVIDCARAVSAALGE